MKESLQQGDGQNKLKEYKLEEDGMLIYKNRVYVPDKNRVYVPDYPELIHLVFK